MAETITTMWAQTLLFRAAYQFQTVDQDGTNTRTVASGAGSSTPKYYRVLLAEAAGSAASEGACQNLLTAFENALNTSGSRYTVDITTDGYVKVTYNGTGTSTLTWTTSASNALRSVLGFTSGWSSLASGASTTAQTQPSHVAYSFVAGDDTGWTTESGHQALGETPDNIFGWTDQKHRVVRSFTLRFHPTLDSDRSALGTSPITPMLPSTHARLATPSGSLIAGGPWSVWELVQTALSDGTYNGRVGLALGTFQALVSGTTTTIDEVFFRQKTRIADKAIRPSVPYWSRRRDWPGIEILRAATLSVAP